MENTINHLKKIEGQVGGIIRMIEEKRDCLEITQQISAIRSGLASINIELLENECQNCIVNQDNSKLLSYVKEILKKN